MLNLMLKITIMMLKSWGISNAKNNVKNSNNNEKIC